MEVPVYIHIPFCIRKCLYCDFVSYTAEEEKIEKYVSGLVKEIGRRGGYTAKTVYMGGGTPTCIDRKHLEEIFAALHKSLDMSSCRELSVEANPGTLDRGKLETLKAFGVNRLSIGLQSWHPAELRKLGRIHGREEFVSNYALARNTGFENISVDLIFGIPEQGLDEWRETLREVTALEPEHISCYSLKIEENTPFHRMAEAGELTEVDHYLDRKMYHWAVDYLEGKGYHRYEISNFARKGRECLHNMYYWDNRPFLGIGAAAHSCLDHVRSWNTDSIDEYCELLNNNCVPVKGSEDIDFDTEVFETIFLGLRTSGGIRFDEFNARFGFDLRERYRKQIERLLDMRLVELSEAGLRLTALGIDLSNTVFIEFITNY